MGFPCSRRTLNNDTVVALKELDNFHLLLIEWQRKEQLLSFCTVSASIASREVVTIV